MYVVLVREIHRYFVDSLDNLCIVTVFLVTTSCLVFDFAFGGELSLASDEDFIIFCAYIYSSLCRTVL